MELIHPDTVKAWRCPDGEVKTMIDIRPRVPLHVRNTFTRFIINRQSLIECGVYGCEAPSQWVQDYMFAIDPYLRIRWDYMHKFQLPTDEYVTRPCFLIERVDTALRAWLPIFHWCDPTTGYPYRLGPMELFDIITKLREGDMRSYETPEDYLKAKRAKAAATRESNSKKATSSILAAVDSLSSAQVAQFIACERAIKLGEPIRAFGRDATFLNKLWELQKVRGMAPIPGTLQAMNPWMQPGKYTRTR